MTAPKFWMPESPIALLAQAQSISIHYRKITKGCGKMVDVPTTTDIATSGITTVLTFLPAAAGLGTAAMGLVDASKAFCGGPSNFGFGYIKADLQKLLPTPQGEQLPAGVGIDRSCIDCSTTFARATPLLPGSSIGCRGR
jgi:hypothetical protein